MDNDDVIFVAGHRGLVGSAICRRLTQDGFERIITRSRGQLDLTNQAAVEQFFQELRPQYVFLAAAHVGGIHANNTYPGDFIRNNLLIQTNVIDSAWRNGCKKLLFLGSSCIYPKYAPQPMREDALLTSVLEATNEPYAIAKIAGLKMCQAYRRQFGFDAITAMPTNLYGPGDYFHPENSHIVPALLRRFHDACRQRASHTEIWGTGTPRRELLHVDDLADAAMFLMHHYSADEPINVGMGSDMPIMDIARLIARTVRYDGAIFVDPTKPDGTPRKLLDVSRINALGWRARIALEDGLQQTYRWFLAHEETLRA